MSDEVKLKKELASCLNQKNASPVHLHSGELLANTFLLCSYLNFDLYH